MTTTNQRISKGEAARITGRAAARFANAETDAKGELISFEALVEDEATRTTKPNRAARRARIFGRGLNGKAAARREQFLIRNARRRQRAIEQAERELAEQLLVDAGAGIVAEEVAA